MRSTDPWSRLYALYANRIGVDASKAVLYLDGVVLEHKGTPEQAECEADDEILIDAKVIDPNYPPN
jgi:hypothetical protein